MASLFRIRLNSLIKSRSFSSILHRDHSTQLTYKKPICFDSLIDNENNPEIILDVLRTAFVHPNGHFGRFSLSIAMLKLNKYKLFYGIPSLLEELKSRSDLQNEHFFSRVISLYAQTGFVNHSIKTFQQMEDMGISRSTKTLNYLILGCVLAQKYDLVNRVFLEFPKIYNLKPDLDTYKTVIRSLFESGSSSSVYSILDEMEKNKCKPDTAMFRTILSRFFKEDKLTDVEKVLKIMGKQDLDNVVSIYELDNVVSIYELRIESLCRLWRSSDASSLLEEMLSKGVKPTPETYCLLIGGFCSEGDLEKAKKIFDIMPKKSCDDFPTLRMFVNCLVEDWKFDEARELVLEIKKFTEDVDLWEEIEEPLPKESWDLFDDEEIEEALHEDEEIEGALPEDVLSILKKLKMASQ